MPIDSVGQRGVVPVKPGAPAQPSSAAGGVKRQDLPGAGQSSPQAVAAGSKQESDIKQAVQDLNNYVQSLRRDLHFTVDDDSGETVVRVMDPVSGDVIRQIPSEEVLAIARNLEKAQGLLFNTQA